MNLGESVENQMSNNGCLAGQRVMLVVIIDYIR